MRIAVKVFDELSTMKKLILVSGDGDFLPLLKRVQRGNIDVVLMGYKTRDSETNRTAREIAIFAGSTFLNLASSDMRSRIEYRGDV